MVKYYPEGIERAFHRVEDCIGRNCVIHNPSAHHMHNWDVVIRTDKMALAERLCPHDVGHPDPDSISYFAIIMGDDDASWMGVHGCDGCCHE